MGGELCCCVFLILASLRSQAKIKKRKEIRKKPHFTDHNDTDQQQKISSVIFFILLSSVFKSLLVLEKLICRSALITKSRSCTTITREYFSLLASSPAHNLGSPKLCNNSKDLTFSVFQKNLQDDARIPPFCASQYRIFTSFTLVKCGCTVGQTAALSQLTANLSKLAFSQLVISFDSLLNPRHTRTSNSLGRRGRRREEGSTQVGGSTGFKFCGSGSVTTGYTLVRETGDCICQCIHCLGEL